MSKGRIPALYLSSLSCDRYSCISGPDLLSQRSQEKKYLGRNVVKEDMKYYKDPRTGSIRRRDCKKCFDLIGLKTLRKE